MQLGNILSMVIKITVICNFRKRLHCILFYDLLLVLSKMHGLFKFKSRKISKAYYGLWVLYVFPFPSAGHWPMGFGLWHLYDPLLAEAIALKETLGWLVKKEVSQVVIESYCLTLVQAISSKQFDSSPIGLVIQECRSLLHQLHNSHLFFVKRSANQAAHTLARVASSMSGQGEWLSSPPSFLFDVLHFDLI